MIRPRTFVAVLAASALALAALVGVGLRPALADHHEKSGDHFNVDPVHSTVIFGARHAGAGYTYGRFNDFEGGFNLGDNPSFKLTVRAGSIDTGNRDRDRHLSGPDFFNAKQFPTITFKSTAAEDKGEAWHVTGKMTMLGETKTITIPVKVLSADASFRGKALGAVHAEFTIKRSDFGMTWGVDKGIVGDEIKAIVALEGVKE